MLKRTFKIILMIALLLGNAASALQSSTDSCNEFIQSIVFSSNIDTEIEGAKDVQQTSPFNELEAQNQPKQDRFSSPFWTPYSNQVFYFRSHYQTKPDYVFNKYLDPPFTDKQRFFEAHTRKLVSPSYTLKSTSSTSRLANWKDSNLVYTGCITYN